MLYGSQSPTFTIAETGSETHGGKCQRFLELADINLLNWQAAMLDDWLARTKYGRWANPTSVLSVPRQNGKTRLVDGRAAFGMQAYGEWVVYTSHLQKTSTETFEEMAAMFDSTKLRKYVKVIRTAIGREEIVLTNGGRCKFLARTRNGGRGQHGDLWIVDEAQELTDEQQGSFLPLLAASRNPQTIYCGTPPDENAVGEVFRRLRRDAKSGAKMMAFSEWAVEEIGDVSEVERWAMANPSLGYLINEETVKSECGQMSHARFARERLGWWSETASVETVIPDDIWEKALTDDPPTGGEVCYAVKFSQDGATGTVAACAVEEGKPPHVEVVESRNMAWGMEWFETFLIERKNAPVVIDGGGHAQDLIGRLTRAGYREKKMKRPTASDFKAATAGFVNALYDGSVTHYEDDALDESATRTARRPIGKDGFGFASLPGADATLIESCCLAHWCATKTNMGRKRETGVCF